MGIPLLLGGLALGGVFNGHSNSNTPPPPPPGQTAATQAATTDQGTKAAAQAAHDSTTAEQQTSSKTPDLVGMTDQTKAQAAAAAQGTSYKDTNTEMGIS